MDQLPLSVALAPNGLNFREKVNRAGNHTNLIADLTIEPIVGGCHGLSSIDISSSPGELAKPNDLPAPYTKPFLIARNT